MATNKSRSQPTAAPENTFRLQPPRIFIHWKAEHILQKMLHETLQGEKYSPDTMKTVSKELTQAVKNRMLALNYRRYKIVVILILGQNSRGGGINVGCRALMHMKFDGYASATFESNEIFATLLAYFLNYE